MRSPKLYDRTIWSDMENLDLEIPAIGVKKEKLDAYRDLMFRYLDGNDAYNTQAVQGGVFKAMRAIAEGKSLIEILRSIDKDISGFQLNWVMNTLGEFSTRGTEIQDLWDKYQKGLEPKKKPARRYKESVPNDLDE